MKVQLKNIKRLVLGSILNSSKAPLVAWSAAIFDFYDEEKQKNTGAYTK